MDRSATAGSRRHKPSHMVLRTGSGSFRILDLAADSCLIEAPGGTAELRGFADIYDGELQVARCLIVLAGPEGDLLRCAFKRRTSVRAAPPEDFAR
jgi:hypothetical protein